MCLIRVLKTLSYILKLPRSLFFSFGQNFALNKNKSYKYLSDRAVATILEGVVSIEVPEIIYI